MFLLNRSSFAFVAATALMGVALLGSAPAARAQATFSENFNSFTTGQNPSTFTIENPTTTSWSVLNPGKNSTGTYLSSLNNNSFSTINASGVDNLTNATLSFDLLNASDSGAVLRWDESNDNAIVLIIRPRAAAGNVGNDLYFARVAGGALQAGQFGGGAFGNESVSLAGTGVVSGGDYRVTFSSTSSASGDIFNASLVNLPGTGTASASVSYTFAPGVAPTSGRGGFYQAGTDINANTLVSQFDNVTLQEMNTPEPNSLLLALPALGGVGAVVIRRRRRGK